MAENEKAKLCRAGACAPAAPGRWSAGRSRGTVWLFRFRPCDCLNNVVQAARLHATSTGEPPAPRSEAPRARERAGFTSICGWDWSTEEEFPLVRSAGPGGTTPAAELT